MNSSRVGFLVFLSILSLCVVNIQPVRPQYSETIYIASDGSVYSSTNFTVPIQRVGEVYTFNDNIIGYSIVIQRDNIVVDGAGYTLQGVGTETGINLSGRTNVTIVNMEIMEFYSGIYLYSSLNNSLSGNNVANNNYGIVLLSSSYNLISGNNITNNGESIVLDGSSSNSVSGNNITNNYRGVSLYSSPDNTLRNNSMNNNYNFAVYGTELSHFVNDVDVSNTINGKKVYWLVNEKDLIISPSTFPHLGFLVLVNCANITVQNLEIANNGQGVILAFTTNSIITQNTITNNNNGVGLYSSSYNLISGNNITNNGESIVLDGSSSNSVSGNNITNNYRGIQLSNSSKSNSIYANNITNNRNGIYLFESSQNTINGNNITKSEVGIGFSASSYNMIYHNYFISNIRQIYDSYMGDSSVTPSVNYWDFGYPLGGNYWNDYAGVDVKSTSNQDQPGSDGIGDTPYIIYENNKDNYPLMPYGSPPAAFIFSPENKTYTANRVDLVFIVSEQPSWMGYSLDGQANVTIAGNTTLTRLSDGPHRLEVYMKDTDGNAGIPETIYFTIAQQSEAFPIKWIVAATAIIAIGGVAFLVYFKKIKKPTRKVRVPGQPPIPPVKKEAARPKKTIPETRKVIYCIHCGEKLPPHAVYCRKCGKKVE